LSGSGLIKSGTGSNREIFSADRRHIEYLKNIRGLAIAGPLISFGGYFHPGTTEAGSIEAGSIEAGSIEFAMGGFLPFGRKS